MSLITVKKIKYLVSQMNGAWNPCKYQTSQISTTNMKMRNKNKLKNQVLNHLKPLQMTTTVIAVAIVLAVSVVISLIPISK